jgi:hypothetical protein
VRRSAVELVNITSTHCRSKVGCVFWTAVRATSSCAANASLSTHARRSALGCLDYDVGVPNLYKGFGFPCPLGGCSGRGLARLERAGSSTISYGRNRCQAMNRSCKIGKRRKHRAGRRLTNVFESKAKLLAMAHSWISLANHAERNSHFEAATTGLTNHGNGPGVVDPAAREHGKP